MGISSDGIGLSYKNKFKHKKTNTKYDKCRENTEMLSIRQEGRLAEESGAGQELDHFKKCSNANTELKPTEIQIDMRTKISA